MKTAAIIMLAMVALLVVAGCSTQKASDTVGKGTPVGDTAADAESQAVDEGSDFVSEDEVEIGSLY